jgi:nucleoside-diphosphate-sugar epimerase
VGAGYVGAELARRLLEAGHQVTGVRRSERPLPEGVRALRADVVSGEGLEQLPRDLDALVYAVSPAERSVPAYRAAYGVGLGRVLAELPSTPVVLVTSTAVFDAVGPRVVDDDTPPAADAPTARELLTAEALLRAHGARTLVVRPSGIYGPGRTSLLSSLLRTPPEPAERDGVTSRIHRDDLARVLEFCLEQRMAGTLLAADPNPATLGEIHDWLRATYDEAALSALPARSPRARREPRSRWLRPSRLLAAGFRFTLPSYREGYGRILSELGVLPRAHSASSADDSERLLEG